MATIAQSKRTPLTISVILILLVCFVAGASGLYLTFAPTSFDEQLAGVAWAGLCVLAAAVAWLPYRGGERWAWYALWAFAAVLIVTAVLLLGNGGAVAMMYAGQAAVVVLGLLLGIPAIAGSA